MESYFKEILQLVGLTHGFYIKYVAFEEHCLISVVLRSKETVVTLKRGCRCIEIALRGSGSQGLHSKVVGKGGVIPSPTFHECEYSLSCHPRPVIGQNE